MPPWDLNCTHTLITLVAPVFRSLRTTARSARQYKRYSTGLPLLRLPGCHTRSLAVRGSRISCELLHTFITPSRSTASPGPAGLPLAGFIGPRFQSVSTTSDTFLRALTDLSANGLMVFQTATSCVAVTRLSYPAAPGFPRCRVVQVSPQTPVLFPVPQQPTCLASVTLSRQVPEVGLSPTFAPQQEARSLPTWPRFNVAQSLGTTPGMSTPDWVEDSIAAISARRSRASSITSTRLQQLTQDWRSRVS